MAEIRYNSRRVWTYSKGTWDPAWYHKFGVPLFSGDEWGRRTVVIGLWFLGYVVWAWRTCWCQECHEVREQNYRFATEREMRGEHPSMECERGSCGGCDGQASGADSRSCSCTCHIGGLAS